MSPVSRMVPMHLVPPVTAVPPARIFAGAETKEIINKKDDYSLEQEVQKTSLRIKYLRIDDKKIDQKK